MQQHDITQLAQLRSDRGRNHRDHTATTQYAASCHATQSWSTTARVAFEEAFVTLAWTKPTDIQTRTPGVPAARRAGQLKRMILKLSLI